MRKWVAVVFFSLLFASSSFADTVLSENFNSVASLGGSGWAFVNNSSPGGTTSWFQGNTGVFDAQSGPADSYIAANFLNAADGGNISTWLITPELDLSNALILTFFTRTETGAPFADNLEVRLSTNGASTDVGATDSSVGDFTTLLLAINPSLDPNGYPQDWTQFSLTISSLGTGAQGRLAFRYTVPDTSVNGDYIGIDTVNVTPTPEPATLSMLLIGAVAFGSHKLARKRKQ